MKKILMKLFVNVLLSIAFGMLLWFGAHSLWLPVTDAGDSEGHGPDIDTIEGQNVIRAKTERYRREAKTTGLIGGAVAFTGLTLLSARPSRRGRQL